MNFSVNKYKGLKVYKSYNSEAYGVVVSAYFRRSDRRLSAFLINTLSLIPMHKVVLLESISKLAKDGIYLRQSCEPQDLLSFYRSSRNEYFLAERPEGIFLDGERVRLSDIYFDMETGEITDIIVSRKRLAKKNRVPINKIEIKDNNIYVE